MVEESAARQVRLKWDGRAGGTLYTDFKAEHSTALDDIMKLNKTV